MDINMPVTLVVKAPNQKIDDQTVEVALSWTIKKLKQHLSSVYPSKPRENQQKLIYSGKLLHDHLTLKDVLRQYDVEQTTHTVHLVCSNSHTELSREETTVPKVTASADDGLRHRHASNTHSAQPDSNVAANQPSNNLSHTHEALQQMYNAHDGGMFYSGAGGSMMPPYGMMPYSPEQMMWVQQMYAQQWEQMMQYMYLQGSYQTPPPSPVTPVPGAQPDPANQERPEEQRPNQRRADQPIRMNAQGGPVLDDDEEDNLNRDWLDWVYTMSRLAVLLSIVYFYSTFSRFILVFGFFFLVYMYQTGWFNFGRDNQRAQPAREAQEQAPAPAPQEPVPPVPAPEPAPAQQQEQEEYEEETDEDASSTTPPTEPPAPPPPGPIVIAWSFLSSFFSSLIPHQPPPVNAN